MQFSGFNLGNVFYPGVHGVVEPLRSISNSVVKRSSGDDIWGVAPEKIARCQVKHFCHACDAKKATLEGWLFLCLDALNLSAAMTQDWLNCGAAMLFTSMSESRRAIEWRPGF